jgi:hypothetical protein
MELVNIVYCTVFGDEVTVEWKGLHEEFHDAELLTTYCSSDQIKKNEMGEHVIRMGEDRCLRDFGREPGEKRPVG